MFISRLVLKLGLVRFATSLLVVLLANVLNRVLIVDLAVPAALVTFSFAFQHVMTPVGLVTGYFSDNYLLRGRHRSPYIWGGMLLSVVVMPFFPTWALELGAQPHSRALLYQGVLLFSLFGIGTTVSATAVNALLVDQIPEPDDRGGALTMVWILTLLGFIVGSALTGVLFPTFDPQTIHKLFRVVTLVVVAITLWGVWNIEPQCETQPTHLHGQMHLWPTLKFLASNRQPLAFFAFLGTSIFFLAIQTFLLTPYGGAVLALPVAQTNHFGIYTSYGILAGMVGVHFLVSLRHWGTRIVLVISLILGAAAFGLLSFTSFRPDPTWGIYALCFLGLARGFYNVGLSHLTMSMAHPSFSGVFMGLWNLASGLALAAGEMAGGFLKDRLFYLTGSESGAYGWVFLLEGVGLLACLLLLAPLSQKKYRPELTVLVADDKPKPY
jgi:BCD family chlorophyll transporter-like MFS transporter